MKLLLTILISTTLCFISFSKKNKGDAAQKRHNKRIKSMKSISRGEHKHILAWGILHKKISKQKSRIKNRIN